MSFDPQRKQAHGMLLGKFLPPHLGHVYLADFARNFVTDLSLVVGTLPTEPIPGDLRFRWMVSLFPDANVIHLDQVLPQDPSEHPDFWKLWRETLERILPEKPDFVFASEKYGHKLAEVLGAKFVPVDRSRQIRPVRATEIRENPYAHWDLIPPCVRAHYALRVCIFGPESTGKSTLAQNLADHFETIAVPEYARTYLEEQNGELAYNDLPMIARGQIASEDALIPHCNRVLITDTDVLATTVWSQFLYGKCDPWIEEVANARPADLYLLTDVDVPCVDDAVRYLPENRSDFLAECEQALTTRGRRFVRLSGTWEARMERAVDAVSGICYNMEL